MNKIVHLLKKIQLRQILAAFMAGALLVISTACSGGRVEAQTPPNYRQDVPAGLEAVPGKKNPRPEVPEKAETNTFKGSSMNEFSDTDPRIGDTGQEKAKALVENAKRNVAPSGNAGEKIQRSLGNLGDVGEKVQQKAEDVKKGTARTIDANTPDTDNLARRAEQATRNAAGNTKAAGKDAQNKLEQAIQGTRDALNKTGDAINNAVD